MGPHPACIVNVRMNSLIVLCKHVCFPAGPTEKLQPDCWWQRQALAGVWTTAPGGARDLRGMVGVQAGQGSVWNSWWLFQIPALLRQASHTMPFTYMCVKFTGLYLYPQAV